MPLSKLIRNSAVTGIVLTNEEKNKINYEKEVIQWLDSYSWDYFLTLTFSHPVKDRIAVSIAIEKFIDKLSTKAFGTRSNKRIVSFPVIEHGNDGKSLHVHMIIQNPAPNIVNPNRREKFNLRDAVIESWINASSSAGNPALTATNDEWMKPVTESEIAIKYMIKQIDPTLREHDNPIVCDQLSLDGRRICR